MDRSGASGHAMGLRSNQQLEAVYRQGMTLRNLCADWCAGKSTKAPWIYMRSFLGLEVFRVVPVCIHINVKAVRQQICSTAFASVSEIRIQSSAEDRMRPRTAVHVMSHPAFWVDNWLSVGCEVLRTTDSSLTLQCTERSSGLADTAVHCKTHATYKRATLRPRPNGFCAQPADKW